MAEVPSTSCDVVVVGGGINGCGIARDLAGRGLKVCLCEQHDLAAHTSSASTKLIHGGLRYLEFYEFSLVRKALQERERLLASAPHIMWPLRFVMPHVPALRPLWMVRTGLWLYDHLAPRRLLPASEVVDLTRHPAGSALQDRYRKGFVYSDGWVDDARLVVLNALDATERGASILTRTRVDRVTRAASGWTLQVRSSTGQGQTVRARALVNAAGPWAESFLREELGMAGTRKLRLVKGSHIVVPRMFAHDHAYILQNQDRRIVFALPYGSRFTLIGTTDVPYDGEPGRPSIDAQEIEYLCSSVNHYFRSQVCAADVVWSYSGVRPLLDDASDDPSAVTRDYRIELDAAASAPLLTVWGGKITTYRKLAEEAADLLGPLLGNKSGAWTAHACLPGGDLSSVLGAAKPAASDFESFVGTMQRRYGWMQASTVRRLARTYGARMTAWLGEASGAAALGGEVAPGIHAAELDYAARVEWARTGDDFLWRRTKLGLELDPTQCRAIDGWFEERRNIELAAAA